jgi:hypothetical protein
MTFKLNVVVSAIAIAMAAWLSGRHPRAAGFLVALPLSSMLAPIRRCYTLAEIEIESGPDGVREGVTTHQRAYRGATFVKLSKSRIRARVKHDLPITFSDERISAHGVLELFRRYLAAIDLPARLRQALGEGGDYGAVRVLLGESLPVEDVDALHLIPPSASPRLGQSSPAPASDGSRRD